MPVADFTSIDLEGDGEDGFLRVPTGAESFVDIDFTAVLFELSGSMKIAVSDFISS